MQQTTSEPTRSPLQETKQIIKGQTFNAASVSENPVVKKNKNLSQTFNAASVGENQSVGKEMIIGQTMKSVAERMKVGKPKKSEKGENPNRTQKSGKGEPSLKKKKVSSKSKKSK